MNFSIDPSYNIICAIIFLSIPLIYFSYRKFIKQSGYNYIIIIRILLIGSLILLFLNPVLKIKKEETEIIPWHLYIDKSLSLNYYKQPSYTSYINAISNFIERLQDKKIRFETYSFGSQLDTVIELSQLKTNANSTNIGLVFDKIRNTVNV